MKNAKRAVYVFFVIAVAIYAFSCVGIDIQRSAIIT